jgi:hypothetical protein
MRSFVVHIAIVPPHPLEFDLVAQAGEVEVMP